MIYLLLLGSVLAVTENSQEQNPLDLLDVAMSTSQEPDVIALGEVKEEWKNYKKTFDKQYQFIAFSYRAQAHITTNLTLSAKDILFYTSKVVGSDNLTYTKDLNVQLNVIGYDNTIYVVFSCLSDGDHQVDMAFISGKNSIKLGFTKKCGKIPNTFLKLEIFNEVDAKTIKNQTVQDNMIYKAKAGSFHIDMKTQQDAQLILSPPNIDYEQKTLQANLTKLQTAEFRSKYKTGGMVDKENIIQPDLKFNCLQESVVNYTVKVNSGIFESPIVFVIEKNCSKDQIQEPITNFTTFPIVIGTTHGQSDVYKPGRVSEYYNKTNKKMRVIPEEESAEIFYISVMRNDYGHELLKKEIRLKNPILDYDRHQLDVIHENPRLTQQVWTKPLDILLIFKCYQRGKHLVTMELDFFYAGTKSQSISISFFKLCSDAIEDDVPSTFFGDLFYYLLCFMAIFFGLYVIKIFKNVLQREALEEQHTLDTTYKRKYDQMQELPVANSEVIL